MYLIRKIGQALTKKKELKTNIMKNFQKWKLNGAKFDQKGSKWDHNKQEILGKMHKKSCLNS